MTIDIRTHDEAEELLATYTVEQIRQLWEDGAFGDSPKAVKDYLQTRIIHGDLEKGAK